MNDTPQRGRQRVGTIERTGPSTGEEDANAPARVRVARERRDLEGEKRELEQELAEAEDDAARREIQGDLDQVNQDLAQNQAELNDIGNFPGTQDELYEMQAARSILDEEIAEQRRLLNESTWDPVRILRNNTTRPELIANLEARRAALERGEGRGVLLGTNDLVVDGVEFILPDSMIDLIPITRLRRLERAYDRLRRARRSRDRARQAGRGRTQERIRRRDERKRRRDARCGTRRSNPVAVATGKPSQVDPAFAVGVILPIVIGSIHDRDGPMTGPFGRFRHSDIDATVAQESDGRLRFIDGDGFAVFFKRPVPTPGLWEDGDTTRGLKLSAGENRSLVVREDDRFTHFRKFKDGLWRVERIEDRNGNTASFSRRPDGRLERIARTDGLAISFSYDSADLRVSATLEGAEGETRQVMRWAYDAAGDMVSAEAIFGDRVAFAYDDAGRRIATRHGNGYTSRHAYDEQGRVVAVQTNGPFDGDRFEYDDEAKITTYLPGGDLDRLEKFHIGPDDTIIAEENALGHIKRTEFEATGFVSAEIDAEGGRTQYRYDADGHVKTITDPAGRENFFYWDEDGNLEMALDEEGHSWDYDYDEKGNLVGIVDALKHRTDIQNNERGQPVGIMRHDGLIERRKYDARGNLVELVDFRGGRTLFAYDGFNRTISITDALGNLTRLEYRDQPGHDFWQPSRSIRPDGVSQSIQLDRERSETRVTDGEDRTVIYRHGFGPNNLLTEVEDPQGGTLRFSYDGQERLVTVENQNGRTWRFERDRAGRVVRETDFDGKTTDYDYDRAHRIVAARMVDGRVFQYGWDPSGLLLSRAATVPGRDEPLTETYGYDGRGFLILAGNASATIALDYDALGRITAETSDGTRIESDFDCCGNRIERRIGEHVTAYAHDPLGALTGLSLNGRGVLAVERDQLGRETRRDSGNGFVLEQRYDTVGQLIRQTAHGAGSRASASRRGLGGPSIPTDVFRSYSWDKSYSPTAIADPLWGLTRYESDMNGQILTASHGEATAGGPPLLARPESGGIPGFPTDTQEVERFAYHKTLDVAASDTALPQRPLGRPMSHWISSAGGRVELAHGPHGERISFSYDAFGHVVERRVERDGFRPKTWRFTWDGFDRMVSAFCPDGAEWAYRYDAFGRRIEKRLVKAGHGSATVGNSGSRFLWDGNLVATETPFGRDGQETGQTVWWHFEPDGFVPLLREERRRAADALSQAVPGPPAERQADEGLDLLLHYVITDHLGTPRELVDEAGALAWSASYRLWGGIRGLWTAAANDNAPRMAGPGGSKMAPPAAAFDGNAALDFAALETTTPEALAALPGADLCPIRFQGQWEDPETGLYYNRFRTYDPLSAQYLSPDPIGINGGLRSHGYVRSAVVWADPYGLQARIPNSTMPAIPGYQRQHIIPWSLRDHPVLARAGNLFHINGPTNLMYLPTCQGAGSGPASRNAGLHRGWTEAHRQYNEQLEQELDALEQQADQRKMNRRCVALAIRRTQLRYRTMLGTGAISLARPC